MLLAATLVSNLPAEAKTEGSLEYSIQAPAKLNYQPRVMRSCEMALTLELKAKDLELETRTQNFYDLQDLLERYVESNSYYLVEAGQSQNIATLLLNKISQIKVTLDTMGAKRPDIAVVLNEVTLLGFAIFKPYADLQVQMGYGLDPQSAAGSEFVQRRYVDSVGWIEQNGWIGADGDTGKPTSKSTRKFIEIEQFMQTNGWLTLNKRQVHAARAEIRKILNAPRYRD